MAASRERDVLDGLESEIFKLVSHGASEKQWAEWLRPPLEHAAAEGNLDLVNKLVEAGADGSAGWRGCGGRTLLYAAAIGGDEGVMSSLLRQGSQPDVNVLASDGGRSTLYEATARGHEAAARLLILAGANVDFSDPEHEHTVLHEAIHGGHERLAKELVMSGANVNVRDIHSATPLHQAACKGLEGVASALLLRGADKDAVDDRGYTALMDAADDGHLAVVETLLAAGADFNMRSTGGDQPAYSALDLAADEGHVPVIRALIIQAGVDADACDGSGTTALHVASESGQEASVDALIEAGSNVHGVCDTGRTALHSAAGFGGPDAVLALLRHGAAVGVQDERGMTPLHFACYRQPKDLLSVVDVLLRWNADEMALDNDGDKPSDLLDTEEAYYCSEDEIERTRVLLSRAPADRAWRRCGWLVMLRARALKVRNTSSDQQGHREDMSVARCEGVGDVRGKTSKSSGAGVDIDRRDLGGAVALLTELQPECVFRSIVGFLG